MLHKMVNGVQVPLTEEEIAEFEAREAEHQLLIESLAATKYQRDRASEYPTIEELVVALLEREEGRPHALNELMIKRLHIKTKYPKPS